MSAMDTTTASQEDRGFDADMEEHNKSEAAKVAPTPPGTSNVAAAVRAKEANLAAKKNPQPAANKNLMHPPSVTPQQSSSGISVAFGALGKSTTPPPRAAPTDAASAARGPAGAAKDDEDDDAEEFMPSKKPVPAGDPHAIKVAALNMEAAKLGIKVSNVQACHYFIDNEEEFQTAGVTFTDCAILSDNNLTGKAYRKSRISLSSVKAKLKEITDALNYNDSQELSLSTQDADAEEFMPPKEEKKEDEHLDPEDEETYDSWNVATFDHEIAEASAELEALTETLDKAGPVHAVLIEFAAQRCRLDELEALRMSTGGNQYKKQRRAVTKELLAQVKQVGSGNSVKEFGKTQFELLIKMCEAQIVRLDGPGKVAKLEERIDSMKHARTLKEYMETSEKREKTDEKLLNQKKRKLAQSLSTEKKHKSSPFK